MELQTRVSVAKFAEKQIQKLPPYIIEALYYWIHSVEHRGIYDVRKLKGYHDEPLKGKRAGHRSIRLNRYYRAIYIEQTTDEVEIIIIEVHKHDY